VGGVFGEIDSREAFFRVLAEARALTADLVRASPAHGVARSLAGQLDAMKQWTDAGRAPTDEERGRITVGLIAARELDQPHDARIVALAAKLHALQQYFEAWPSDAEAASATDDDYWARFGLGGPGDT
jgi:hypothetical protein